jgi:hypothetical protein
MKTNIYILKIMKKMKNEYDLKKIKSHGYFGIQI